MAAFPERADEQIRIDCSGRGAMLLRQRGGKTGRLADLHPDRLQSHRAPRHVRGAQTDRNEQVVDLLWQQAAIGHLRGPRLLGKDELAVVFVAGAAVGGAIVRVHAPVGEGDAVGMDWRPRLAGRGNVVVLGEDLPAHDAAGLADIDLVGQVVVVAEFIERQADAAEAVARRGRHRLVVLQEIHEPEREAGVPGDDLLPLRPGGLRVCVVLTRQDRAIPAALAVDRARVQALAVVVQIGLAVVAGRLLRQADLARLVADAEAVVVGLDRTIRGVRARRIDAPLGVGVGVEVQPALNRVLRPRHRDDVGEHLPRMRLAKLLAALAADAIRHLRDRCEVALVGGIDERAAAHRDVVCRAVLAQRQRFHKRPLTRHRRRMVKNQRGDIGFRRHEPVEEPLGHGRLEAAHWIMRLRVTRRGELRRVVAVGLAVVIFDHPRIFVEDRRPRPAVERVPLHEPVGQHAAEVTVVLHEQRLQSLPGPPHRAGNPCRRAADDHEVERLSIYLRCTVGTHGRNGRRAAGQRAQHAVEHGTTGAFGGRRVLALSEVHLTGEVGGVERALAQRGETAFPDRPRG